MKSLSLLIGPCLALGLANLAGASGSTADNLLQNPNFDADLSGWTDLGSGVMWTAAQDHHAAGSTGVGSVQVPWSSSGATLLVQCVTVDHDRRYFASAWAKSSCDGGAEFDLFWGDVDCNVSVSALHATTSGTGAWQSMTLAGASPASAARDLTAVVVLQNTSACDSDVYFDDISLIVDTIFSGDFEPKF